MYGQSRRSSQVSGRPAQAQLVPRHPGVATHARTHTHTHAHAHTHVPTHARTDSLRVRPSLLGENQGLGFFRLLRSSVDPFSFSRDDRDTSRADFQFPFSRIGNFSAKIQKKSVLKNEFQTKVHTVPSQRTSQEFRKQILYKSVYGIQWDFFFHFLPENVDF